MADQRSRERPSKAPVHSHLFFILSYAVSCGGTSRKHQRASSSSDFALAADFGRHVSRARDLVRLHRQLLRARTGATDCKVSVDCAATFSRGLLTSFESSGPCQLWLLPEQDARHSRSAAIEDRRLRSLSGLVIAQSRALIGLTTWPDARHVKHRTCIEALASVHTMRPDAPLRSECRASSAGCRRSSRRRQPCQGHGSCRYQRSRRHAVTKMLRSKFDRLRAFVKSMTPALAPSMQRVLRGPPCRPVIPC